MERLVKLVAKHIPVPAVDGVEDSEKVVKSIIENIQIE